MIISTDVEKTFNKIWHPFKTKTLNKLGMEGTYLKTWTYYQYSEWGFKAGNIYPIGSGTIQECPLSPLLLCMVLEFLARAIRKRKK
jgi:hypothetical protein